MQSMVGDAWHLRYQGLLLMYVFATLDDAIVAVPMSLPLLPAGSTDHDGNADGDDATTPAKRHKVRRTGNTASSPGAASAASSCGALSVAASD